MTIIDAISIIMIINTAKTGNMRCEVDKIENKVVIYDK